MTVPVSVLSVSELAASPGSLTEPLLLTAAHAASVPGGIAVESALTLIVTSTVSFSGAVVLPSPAPSEPTLQVTTWPTTPQLPSEPLGGFLS